MAATHRRWSRREREAAEILGTKRVHRSRFEVAPDVERVVAPNGRGVQAEVKTRKRLPAWLTDWLAQAARYSLPGDAAVVVVSETGGRALAVTWAEDFADLTGLKPKALPPQQALPIASAPETEPENNGEPT